MQIGIPSLIHTAALARWTKGGLLSFGNRFNGFGSGFRGIST